jgi:hypothetical protein
VAKTGVSDSKERKTTTGSGVKPKVIRIEGRLIKRSADPERDRARLKELVRRADADTE